MTRRLCRKPSAWYPKKNDRSERADLGSRSCSNGAPFELKSPLPSR
nr:MAG TPA: hypothetical protein [Caudoviricetes sp.]